MANVVIPSHVAYEVLDGEAVLLNLNTGVYFELNASATAAFELLLKGRGVEHVVSRFEHDYARDAQVLRHDLGAWLNQLEQAGLVTRASDP